MEDIRIAAAVLNARVGRLSENLDRVISFTLEARKKGAALICFPEMNLTGYSSNNKIKDRAIRKIGIVTDKLQEVSDSKKITILAGLAETDDQGKLFASHLVITPGEKPGIYRKTHLGPPEEGVFSPGSAIPLFKVNDFTFGIQLCYDAHFPHLATCMAEAGADAIFIPHASPRGTPDEKLNSWLRHLPARAYDNSLFVIACNQTGENGTGLTFPGTALVIDPSGKVMAKYAAWDETILFADLKKETLLNVRNHKMRYFLPRRRKDI